MSGLSQSVPAAAGRLHYSSVRDIVCAECDSACREWWAGQPGEERTGGGRLR